MRPVKSRQEPVTLGGRLFLALPPPSACSAEIERWLDARTRGRGLPGRRVPPERWHLTLKFLGDTSESDAFRLCEAMDRSDLGGAFDLRFAGLGAFPNAGRAKVLWIGCDEGAAALIRLAGVVEKAADHAGFASEATPYRPHLTLSRLRPPQDLRSLVERGSSVEEAESRGRGIAGTMPLMIMRAETVWLYRSHLGHRSVRYERLRSWSLGADAAVERQP